MQNSTEREVNDFTNNGDFCILCPKCLQFPGLTRGEKKERPGFPLRLVSGSSPVSIPFYMQPALVADGYKHTCSLHAVAPPRSNKVPPMQPPDQILNCSTHSGWFIAGRDSTQPETEGESFILWLNLQLNNSSLKFLQDKTIYICAIPGKL